MTDFLYLYSVPISHGLSNTMFKLIIPRGYDSDEDIALDVSNYGKETHPTTSLSPKKENFTSTNRAIDKQNLLADNDPGGTRIDTLILSYIIDKCRNK